MILGRKVQTPDERKRYSIDYNEWLDSGEVVTSVVFSVTPVTAGSLTVDSSAISSDGKEVVFFASLGDAGTEYAVVVVTTTSGGQIKEDTIYFSIRES